MTRHTDLLVAEVQYEHVLRLDTPTDDLGPRPFSARPRPNTALISQACAAKLAERLTGEPQSFRGKRKPRRKREPYEYLRGIRQLNTMEICEFKAAVSAAIQARCTPSNPCWEPNCPRCKPA